MTRKQFFGAGNPVVTLNRIETQEAMELHGHDFTEIVLITGGEGLHDTGAGSRPVSARSLFVVKEGQVHGYRESRDLRLTNVMFRSDLLELDRSDVTALPGYHALFRIEPGMDDAESRPHLRIPANPWRVLMGLADRLEEELAAGRGGSQAYSRALLTAIIIEASRAYPGDAETADRGTLGLARIFSHMEENFHRRLTTPELAAMAGMSLSTLQRRFRRVTGTTLTAYINHLRLLHAEELLRETDLSITEIAFRAGFEDSNYFSKLFRKNRGTSPRRFRKG